MTPKRFEMGYDDGLLRFVKDNVTNTNLDIVDCLTVLNELNDENEQLKTELKDCHKSNHEYYIDKDKLIRLCTRFNIDWKKELEK